MPQTFSSHAVASRQRPPGSGTAALLDPAWHLAALFAVAIALGGGGVGAGFANLCAQLAALAVIALHPRAFSLFFLRRPSALAVLALLSLALVAIQLIPLPPALWTTLPGRELVSASLGVTGASGDVWFPISLDARQTLTSLIGMLLPLTVIVVGSVLPTERLRWLAGVVILLGAIAVVYGVLTLLSPQNASLGGTASGPSMARMGATFADWNGAALFFVSCLLIIVGLWRPGRPIAASPIQIMVTLGSAVLLLVGVLVTQSRSGTALLAVPVVLLILVALLGRKATNTELTSARSPKIALLALLVPLLVVVAGVAAISGNSRLSASFDRFAAGGDGKRAEMREDSLAAAQRYWPVGAGMGTFGEVFAVDESLEYLSPRPAGRAHMDYYELAIEAGIAGIALLAGWAIWALALTWQALRRLDWLALAGSGILACCALQSILSFPLRSQTMLAMAALAVVLLSRAGHVARTSK